MIFSEQATNLWKSTSMRHTSQRHILTYGDLEEEPNSNLKAWVLAQSILMAFVQKLNTHTHSIWMKFVVTACLADYPQSSSRLCVPFQEINQSSETMKWQISPGINEPLQSVDIKKVNFLHFSLLLTRCLNSVLVHIEVQKQCRQVCVWSDWHLPRHPWDRVVKHCKDLLLLQLWWQKPKHYSWINVWLFTAERDPAKPFRVWCVTSARRSSCICPSSETQLDLPRFRLYI